MIEYEGKIQDINQRFIMKVQLKCSYCLKTFYSYHNHCNNFLGFGFHFKDDLKIHYCPYCDKYCITNNHCETVLKVEKRSNIFMKIIVRLFNDNKRTNMQMEMRKMQ